MATDTRSDEGQVYPGGKMIYKRPQPGGGGGGDMYHSEFADLDPETVDLATVVARLKGSN